MVDSYKVIINQLVIYKQILLLLFLTKGHKISCTTISIGICFIRFIGARTSNINILSIQELFLSSGFITLMRSSITINSDIRTFFFIFSFQFFLLSYIIITYSKQFSSLRKLNIQNSSFCSIFHLYPLN